MMAAVAARTTLRITLLQPLTPFQTSLVSQRLYITGFPESHLSLNFLFSSVKDSAALRTNDEQVIALAYMNTFNCQVPNFDHMTSSVVLTEAVNVMDASNKARGCKFAWHHKFSDLVSTEIWRCLASIGSRLL